jgi:hypothetical protein
VSAVRRTHALGAPRSSRYGALLVVLAALLAFAAPAAHAQSGPDAAPSGSSHGPSPDPAPIGKRAPKPTVAVRAPTQTTTAPATGFASPSSAPRPAAGSTTRPRSRGTKAAKRRTPRSSASRHRRLAAVASALSLPRLSLGRLALLPSHSGDQARRLAIGGLALLLLALASAMLLAFTLRTDRGRRLR